MSRLPTTTSAATAGDLANMLTDVEPAIGSIPPAASTLGATTTNLRNQRTSNLSDSLTTGVGSLVDASMNEAATKLAAVQVEHQLGVRALRLSDTSTRLILKLFEL
jgi:flagellin